MCPPSPGGATLLCPESPVHLERVQPVLLSKGLSTQGTDGQHAGQEGGGRAKVASPDHLLRNGWKRGKPVEVWEREEGWRTQPSKCIVPSSPASADTAAAQPGVPWMESWH